MPTPDASTPVTTHDCLGHTPAMGRLTDEINVAAFGGDAVAYADVNGDGHSEFVILQNPGQFATQLSAGRDDLDTTDQMLFCLTAIDRSGSVLWQVGEPYDRPFPYTAHGVQGNQQLAIADIDADGATEIVVVRRDELLVIDGRTGRIKRSARLPMDNFLMVDTAQFGDPSEGRQVLLKVNDLAHAPWEYSNPMMVFNADLTVRHEPFAVRGAGHNYVIHDIDGDGRDEVFVGYSLFDHDGRLMWSLDLGEGFDYAQDHADHIGLSDIDGDGELELRYAGSDDFIVCSVRGEVLWKVEAGHSQQSAAGPWGRGGEHRIIMAENNAGLTGIGAAGEVVWRRPEVNGYVTASLPWPDAGGEMRDWGLFRPQLRPIRPTPYQSDPSWSRGIWPCLIDGDGQSHDFLPWEDHFAHPAQHIRAARSYDCGIKYYPLILSGEGAATVTIAVYDRNWIRIFTSPAPSVTTT